MAAQKINVGSTTSTASRFGPLDSVNSTASFIPQQEGAVRKPKAGSSISEQVDRAVVAHLRAMRTLGNTTANSIQIARALSLDKGTVEKSLLRLKDQGVKVRPR